MVHAYHVREWRGQRQRQLLRLPDLSTRQLDFRSAFVHPFVPSIGSIPRTICSVSIATAVAPGHGDDDEVAPREAEIRDCRVVFRLFCGGQFWSITVASVERGEGGECQGSHLEITGASCSADCAAAAASFLARVDKSATAVTEIDAAEIINKRKPRTKNTESKERSASLH